MLLTTFFFIIQAHFNRLWISINTSVFKVKVASEVLHVCNKNRKCVLVLIVTVCTLIKVEVIWMSELSIFVLNMTYCLYFLFFVSLLLSPNSPALYLHLEAHKTQGKFPSLIFHLATFCHTLRRRFKKKSFVVCLRK